MSTVHSCGQLADHRLNIYYLSMLNHLWMSSTIHWSVCVRNQPITGQYVWEINQSLVNVCEKSTNHWLVCLRNQPITGQYVWEINQVLDNRVTRLMLPDFSELRWTVQQSTQTQRVWIVEPSRPVLDTHKGWLCVMVWTHGCGSNRSLTAKIVFYTILKPRTTAAFYILTNWRYVQTAAWPQPDPQPDLQPDLSSLYINYGDVTQTAEVWTAAVCLGH